MVLWNYDYLYDIFDGLFIFNGFGDFVLVWDIILNLRKVLKVILIIIFKFGVERVLEEIWLDGVVGVLRVLLELWCEVYWGGLK